MAKFCECSGFVCHGGILAPLRAARVLSVRLPGVSSLRSSTPGWFLAALRAAPRMTAPLLQLTRVTKSFGAVRALKGVSFDLREGEVHALIGENGAGKSTLIKIITCAHQPDGGTIELAGQPVRHLTPAAAHKLG